MSEILYVYKKQVYVNLTNKCSANCVYCVRNKKEGVDNHNLVLEKDPTSSELISEMDAFDFHDYEELVFCGYGEPTCAMENLLTTAEYFKKNHSQKIRVNTNGLGRLYNGWDILSKLNKVVDSYSISLNAPNEERYYQLVRPSYEHAFQEVISFAKDAKKAKKEVFFSVVDVLTDEEIDLCRDLAGKLDIPLKVRKYEE